MDLEQKILVLENQIEDISNKFKAQQERYSIIINEINILKKKLNSSIRCNIRMDYPEDKRFDGSASLPWEQFIYFFKLFYQNPTKADFIGALKDDAYILMCALDITTEMGYQELFDTFEYIFKKPLETLKRDYFLFIYYNKYPTLKVQL